MAKSVTKDLTVGSPVKQILLFAIPFLIGNVFQQVYNIADMIIVGRTMDPLAYAAVGSTGSLVWFVTGPIGGISAGFSAIVAQHFGAGDEQKVKRAFASSIKLFVIIAALMSVGFVFLARPLLHILRTPDTLMSDAYSYVVWIFAGLVATAMYNLLSSVIRALGDSRTPLYFLILACLINIVLDVVFIKFCGWGTAGAGIATVTAQLISGLMCVVYIAKKLPILHISSRHFKSNSKMDSSLLKIGLPMGFLQMILAIGSIIVQFVTNGFGDTYVSSQVTGAKIEQFITQVVLSLGSAVAVFASQNYGAKKYGRVIDGCRKTVIISFIWSIIAPLVMLPLGKLIIRLVAGNVDSVVVDNAYTYILINTVFIFVLGPLVIIKSILPAVGITRWTMVSGFTEVVGRAGIAVLVVTLTALNAVSDPVGFIIVCFSNPAAWLFGLLTVLIDYIAMRKKFKRLIKDQIENAGKGVLADAKTDG